MAVINGAMLAKTIADAMASKGDSGKYEDYKEELKNIAQLMVGDETGGLTEGRKLLDQILGGLEGKEKEYAQGFLDEQLGALAKESGVDLNDDHKKMMRDIVMGQAGMSAVGMGVGLFQAIEAQSRLNNLDPPKMPEMRTKNEGLRSALNETTRLAEEGDPALRSFFEGKLAELGMLSNERAKSAGNAGQYLGNSQASDIASRKALRDFNQQMELNKNNYRQQRNQLIGQDIAEDRDLQNERYRRFGVEYDAYANSVNEFGAQRNSGLSNFFDGLSGMSELYPAIVQSSDGKKMVRREGNGFLREFSPMKLLKMGSDNERKNPQAVMQFQDYLDAAGFGGEQMERGVFGPYEEQLFEDLNDINFQIGNYNDVA